MRLRAAISFLVITCFALVAAAKDEPAGMGRMPEAAHLTTKDVERLIKLMPRVAKEGAKHNAKSREGEPLDPKNLPPEVKNIQSMLAAEGLSMPEFALQMTTLVSTFLALSPDALDEQIPSEKSPEVQKILNDPKIPAEQKAEVRQQIAVAQENKDEIRAQLTSLATEDNKKVVRPLLPKVKAALDAARAEAVKVDAHEAGARPAK